MGNIAFLKEGTWKRVYCYLFIRIGLIIAITIQLIGF